MLGRYTAFRLIPGAFNASDVSARSPSAVADKDRTTPRRPERKSLYLSTMCSDLPLYAVQRSAGSGRWLVLALDADPLRPAVRVVAVLREPGASATGVSKTNGASRTKRSRACQDRVGAMNSSRCASA